MSLDALRLKPGDGPLPTAEKQNAILAHLLRQRIANVLADFDEPQTFPHPWRVRAQRFEPPAASTIAPEAAWRIDIAAGAINDTAPVILYHREKDPRGWQKPADYSERSTPDSRPSTFLERDLLDDPEDPPCLVAFDPPSGDFEQIPDERRITIERGAFCSAEAWELELWRSHVVLTADPGQSRLFDITLPPPKLARYRFSISAKQPPPNVGGFARAGGTFVLAKLYLLRDPGSPADAVLRVKQEEFWPLWAAIAQPGRDLPAIPFPLPVNLDELATVEAWSV